MFKIIMYSLGVLSLAAPSWAIDGFGSAVVGGGAQTTVLTVTSLQDSGPGSLRDAVATAASLTSQSTDCATAGVLINSSVSGDINLSGDIQLRFAGCVTIDGGGQITLNGATFAVRDAANIILTGLRSRNASDDGFRFQNVDLGAMTHSSSFGHGDGGFDVVDGSTQITVSDNLVHHDPTQNAQGMLALQFFPTEASRVDQVTYARNIFSDLGRRQPQVATEGRADIINNLVRQWGAPQSAGGSGTRVVGNSHGDMTNNVYSKDFAHDNDAVIIESPADYHISGNLSLGVAPNDVNALSTEANSFGGTGVSQVPADDVICLVKDNAGPRPLDSLDQSLIDTVSADCVDVPGDTTLFATQDADLDENSPNKNSPGLELHRVLSWDAQPGGGQDNHRAIVQFDTSSLTSSVTATLELCLTRINSGNVDIDISVHRLTESWIESEVTATERETGTPWSAYFGSFVSGASDTITVNKNVDGRRPNRFYSWNVTSDVQAMIAGTDSNHGWIIRHDPEGGDFTRTDWVTSEGTTTECGALSGPRLVITD